MISQNNAIMTKTLASSGVLVAYEGRPTPAVEQIMRNVVVDGSKATYTGLNIQFILWLYDNEETREEFLSDWFLEKLIEAEKCDKNIANERSRAKSRRHKL